MAWFKSATRSLVGMVSAFSNMPSHRLAYNIFLMLLFIRSSVISPLFTARLIAVIAVGIFAEYSKMSFPAFNASTSACPEG